MTDFGLVTQSASFTLTTETPVFNLTSSQVVFGLSTSGVPGPRGLQGEDGVQGDPGPGFTPTGDWVNGTQYNSGDLVIWNSAVYLDLVDNNIGNSPTDRPDFWQLFVPPGPAGTDGSDGNDGSAGDPGPGFVSKGEYDPDYLSGAGYSVGDVVSFDGSSYACIVDGTVGSPSDFPSRWSLMASKGADGDPGTDGSDGTNGSDGSTGPAGASTFGMACRYRGIWDVLDYKVGDFVRGQSNSNTYIAEVDGLTNNPESDLTNWIQVSAYIPVYLTCDNSTQDPTVDHPAAAPGSLMIRHGDDPEVWQCHQTDGTDWRPLSSGDTPKIRYYPLVVTDDTLRDGTATEVMLDTGGGARFGPLSLSDLVATGLPVIYNGQDLSHGDDEFSGVIQPTASGPWTVLPLDTGEFVISATTGDVWVGTNTNGPNGAIDKDHAATQLMRSGRNKASDMPFDNTTAQLECDDGLTFVQQAIDALKVIADSKVTGTDITDVIDALSLDTASTHPATDFATAAQGAEADTAVQPARTIATGTGLLGGGDLSVDRTLTPDFGAGTGKVTEGDDSRLSDTRTPTDGSVTIAKFVSGVLSTATDLGGGSPSNTVIPSQAAVKAYSDALIAAADAMIFKGVIDCSTNPNYPAADRGWTYKVSVAGKIGGASGVNVEVGDTLLCITDSMASGNQATVGTAWTIIQANIDGAVVGPASVTDGVPVLFDGTSGKLIKATTFASLKTAMSFVKADVGLGNVDNTSDATKQTAFDLRYQAISTALTSIAGLSLTNDDVLQVKAGAITQRTPAQLKTDLTLVKGDVGLGNVDNTSDSTKQTAFDARYQAINALLTDVSGLTFSANDVVQYKSGHLANRTMAQLKADLAIAEGDVTNLTTDLAAKAPLASPTFTGTPTVPGYAPTASPTFTGTVVVPDASTATGAMNRETCDARYQQITTLLTSIVGVTIAKGTIIAGTGSAAVAGLAVGSNNQVLTADSSQTTGLKFVTPIYTPVSAFASGQYSVQQVFTTNSGLTSNRVHYIPFFVHTPTTFTTMGVAHQATTAGAGSIGKLAIYNDSGGLPASLLLDAGSVALDTAAAFKTVTAFSQALAAGLYWLAFLPQITSLVPTFNIGNSLITAPSIDATYGGIKFQNSVSGAFTNPAVPNTSQSTGVGVIIFMKAA